MKLLLTLGVVLTSVVGSNAQTLTEVRSKFHSAVLNPNQSKEFHKFLEEAESENHTIQAYKAVSEAMLAQVLWNPFSKLSQVSKYEKLMNKIVDDAPENIEVRFLRLAIEYNLPPFLGMSSHLKEDTQIIIQNLGQVNEMQIEKSYSTYIYHFMSQTDLVSEDEINVMEQALSMN